MLPLKEALTRLQLPDYITFDTTTYCGWKKKARFVDSVYGEWWTLPLYVHMGHEHPTRGKIKQGENVKVTLQEAKERLGSYSDWLVDSTYVNWREKACFLHPSEGEWWVRPYTVAKGHEHPTVGRKKRVKTNIHKYGKAANYEAAPIDIVGKQFNSLTVISLFSRSPVKWKCKCTCGKEVTVKTSSLNNGKKKSCGCLTAEKRKSESYAFRDQLRGQKYGFWTVLEPDRNKTAYVICKCDCGTIRSVYKHSLLDGISICCGCITPVYKTEEKCREIIEQITDKKWTKARILRNPETNTLMELDGYNAELQMAFEYDGEQHYSSVPFGHKSFEFDKIQKMDKLKDQLCIENHIRLLRIPYWEKENLELFIRESLSKILES